MDAKGTYPDWQRRLREAQSARDEARRQEQEAAACRQKEQDRARQEKLNREIKTILGFLGIEAEPTGGRWKIDDVVFCSPELAIRTTNSGIQTSWAVTVTPASDHDLHDLLAWYKSVNLNQYTDPWSEGQLCKPEWPSIKVATREYRDEQHDWRAEQAALADALDTIADRVEKIRIQWAADQKTFEERKRRAEQRAREEELRREAAAQQAEEEAGWDDEETDAAPAQAEPPSLEQRLAATLREFIHEVTRPPEY